MESLMENPLFIDGIKRVGLLWWMFSMMGLLNAGEFDLEHLSRWLEGIVVTEKSAVGRLR
jgi:hypothetical protein